MGAYSKSTNYLTAEAMAQQFVTTDVFITQSQQLETRLAYMENRLNEIFTSVDTKVGEINVKLTQMGSGMEQVNARQLDGDTKLVFLEAERLKISAAIEGGIQERQDQLEARLKESGEMMSGMRDFIRMSETRVQELSTAMSAELNASRAQFVQINSRIDSIPTGGSGGSSGGHSKSILDAKDLILENFDGDKKDRRLYTKWRTNLDSRAEHHYTGVKSVLESIARHKSELDIETIRHVISEAGIQEQSLSWSIERVDAELGHFLLYKTTGDAQSVCESHDFGGFESYRLMNIEYDAITENTKGAMTANLVAMTKQTASSPKQLKKLIREMDKRVKEYKKKLGETPDPTLVGSILTAMLDEETSKILLQNNIYGNYIETRKLLSTLQTEIKGFGGSDPMEIGLCQECTSDDEDEKLTLAKCSTPGCKTH